jgi:hypothetical protein
MKICIRIMKTLQRFALAGLAGMLLWSFHGFGQSFDNWQWRNPLPNGNPPVLSEGLYGIVFTNGQFLAVGQGGVIAISANGADWTQASTATTNELDGIIYANGSYVAVGASGAVETSPDGTNWVLQNSGTTNGLAAVAYADGHYVAVGPSAAITSSDAVHWSSAVSGLSGANGVAGGSQGFVAALGPVDVAVACQSPNGMTWTNNTLPVPATGGSYTSPCYGSVVSFADGVYVIGAGQQVSSGSCAEYVFTSSDGLTWTPHFVQFFYGSLFPQFAFLMSGNGIVVGVGDDYGGTSSSSDFVDWTNASPFPNSYRLTAGAYGNGQFVVVGATPAAEMFTSSDAVNWTNQTYVPAPPTGPTSAFASIASGNGVYVAASASSLARSSDDVTYTNVSGSPGLSAVVFSSGTFTGVGPGGAIYQSSDGVTWTQRNSATTEDLNAVTSGGGLLVAVGASGAIQTATTGTVWTSRTSGTSLALNGVTYANGLYVAVGQHGTILTSPDAINWSGQFSGTLSNLTSVTAGSAGFVAVGTGGVVVLSGDGVTWSSENSGTAATLNAVCFGNGYYLAAGNDAIVLTSLDGETWRPLNVGLTGGQNLYGCAFLNGSFDLVGSGGTVLESGVVAPLLDLQIHSVSGSKVLTIFSAAQKSFRLQSTTNLATPQWTDVLTNATPSSINLWTNTAASSAAFYRISSP